MKKWIFVFLIAFGLNLIWENLHSVLYVHYRGGIITRFILFRAAIIDGIIVLTLLLFLTLLFKTKYQPYLMIIVGIIVAVLLEIWALGQGRWAYQAIMPIIPVIKTGLSPTIQLALTGFLTYAISKNWSF